MSETTPEPKPRSNRGGTVLLIVIALAVLGGITWFVLSQNTDSAAPPPAPAPSSSSAQPAQPSEPQPSATPSPTPTVKPLRTPEEVMRLNTYSDEWTVFHSDAPGVPVPLSEANRFSAPYSEEMGRLGAPSGDCGYATETTQGWLFVQPLTNTPEDGMFGTIAHC